MTDIIFASGKADFSEIADEIIERLKLMGGYWMEHQHYF